MELSAAPLYGGVPPEGLRPFRYGFVNFQLPSNFECGFLCPGLPPQRVQQQMQLEFPAELPAGATIWAFVPSDDNPNPTWQPVPAKIDGRLATFVVASASAFFTPTVDRNLRGSVGVSLPTSLVADPKNLQDLWWGGPGEDGWGVAIAQAGDRLFATFHVYDESGQPVFYLLHDGSWDSTRTVFSGALYHPNARTMGGPVGSASLTFADADNATLRYTLTAGEGAKSLQRMPFGPAAAQGDPQAGIWDLVNAGTGAMTISKRGDTLFITWLDFPAGGPGQWRVAPAGTWLSTDTYHATLYRTTGGRWAGAEYDASRLGVELAGAITVRFTGPDDGEVTYTVDGVTQSSALKRHAF